MCPTAGFSLQFCRRRWRIFGQVQGVGYRPFVYRLAHRCQVGGFVCNDDRGVLIEAQGSAAQLKRFSRALDAERPPLAFIEQVIVEDISSREGSPLDYFHIVDSDPCRESQADDAARVGVTIDSAVCAACLAELADPADRRHRYGLTNCTDCGPRYTIIDRVPYDRPNTTMRDFPLCDACHKEYTEPIDRRYHAQPIACYDCGPSLELVGPDGGAIQGDPITSAVRLLSRGRVVAVKGLGGFHLAVRADDESAVARLRESKQRDGKPFALMCRSIDAVRRLVDLSPSAEAMLCSPAAPIMLAPRKHNSHVAPSVAPDSHRLGVMLAYTPIQHLLFAELDPAIDALVMTSANPSGEPLTIDNDEALARLSGLCDAILWHDRPIRRRVDDSVVLDAGLSKPLPLRRARGFVPMSIALPVGGDTHGLCVGGELKNTIALIRDKRATLSQHLGDLSYTPVFDHFRETVDDLVDLFDIQPQWIAHDLHPMYLGTSHAGALAKRWDVPLIGVQHHHAHAAAVMAEHGETGQVLAVVCDGVGYGSDGTSWGGELLLADLTSFKRLAHLRPIQLIGGDAAAHDTRRCGLAMLQQAFGDSFADHPAALALFKDDNERQMLTGMLERGLNCSPSTALGRYFDGVSALLGLSTHNSYEAQAAMRLESAAYGCDTRLSNEPLFEFTSGDTREIDLSPLIGAIVSGRADGESIEALSAMFHDQLAWAWADAVDAAARDSGVRTVALSGGVFCNERLTRGLSDRLDRAGLRVLVHSEVPANDGGLALGQAAVAAAKYDAGLHREVDLPCV
jgi:hydrogenase maturation protein HypF